MIRVYSKSLLLVHENCYEDLDRFQFRYIKTVCVFPTANAFIIMIAEMPLSRMSEGTYAFPALPWSF